MLTRRMRRDRPSGRRVRKRHLVALLAAGAGFLLFGALPAGASSAICVGSRPGCFSTIQAAVDAAHDGDTITIAPGTYSGPIHINASVNLAGAGAPATIIKGGGPVIVIGEPFPWSPKQPTISISGVTVTGGVNSSYEFPEVTSGGGIMIEPSANPDPDQPPLTGATVTISNSIVTGNHVYSTGTIPGDFCGLPVDCAFANGGGIANNGALTLVNTRVSDNLSSSPPGTATGLGSGGISNAPVGTLELDHSWVTGNRAIGSDPHALEGSGGGIGSNGQLSIDHSFVNDNVVSISSSAGTDLGQVALAGGILVDCCGAGTATIAYTHINGNSVSASNVGNDATAFGGAIVGFAPVSISHSSLDHNSVSATSSSGGNAYADGGGAEFDDVTTLTDVTVSWNTVSANSPGSYASAQGGGIANASGQTTLTNVVVVNNMATASSASGVVQGGGIWNGTFGGPDPRLTVQNSSVVHNSLSASPGLTVQGGGLYSDFPLTLTGTNITANVPDQCFGCS
jgi:hypothetical protein